VLLAFLHSQRVILDFGMNGAKENHRIRLRCQNFSTPCRPKMKTRSSPSGPPEGRGQVDHAHGGGTAADGSRHVTALG
jgi:hypothetical protein